MPTHSWYADYVRQEFFDYAHERNLRGKGATVAVIDTGCYRQYIPPQLDDSIDPIPKCKEYSEYLENMSSKNRKANRLNFTRESQVGGTHATINAGMINLVAPEASILDIKVGASNATTDAGPLLKALDSCILMHKKKKRPDIINLSMGVWREFSHCNGSCESSAFVDNAFEEGLLLVVASGNRGAHTIACPACATSALTVGAARESAGRRSVSRNSSYLARKPDIVAPSGIPTTTINTIDIFPAFKFMSSHLLLGTSFATPLVSGLGAILFGICKDIEIVKQAIIGSAKPLPNVPNAAQGQGVVRPSKAIEHVQNVMRRS